MKTENIVKTNPKRRWASTGMGIMRRVTVTRARSVKLGLLLAGNLAVAALLAGGAMGGEIGGGFCGSTQEEGCNCDAMEPDTCLKDGSSMELECKMDGTDTVTRDRLTGEWTEDPCPGAD